MVPDSTEVERVLAFRHSQGFDDICSTSGSRLWVEFVVLRHQDVVKRYLFDGRSTISRSEASTLPEPCRLKVIKILISLGIGDILYKVEAGVEPNHDPIFFYVPC